MESCNTNIEKLIAVAEELLSLSDVGDIDRNDDSCGVLYGLARDMAYNLLAEAQKEKDKHIDAGKWR